VATISSIGASILDFSKPQQSSERLYRLYDYDRKDDAGKLERTAHPINRFDVTTVPQ